MHPVSQGFTSAWSPQPVQDCCRHSERHCVPGYDDHGDEQGQVHVLVEAMLSSATRGGHLLGREHVLGSDDEMSISGNVSKAPAGPSVPGPPARCTTPGTAWPSPWTARAAR